MPDATLVLTHAGSGSYDESVLAQVRQILDEGGQTVRIHRLGDGAGDDGPLAVAVSEPFDRLVIAGGDGAVHHVISELDTWGRLSSDRPIGLLPLGTGNDLARSIGLPLDPPDAARILLTGRPRPMDLVTDDTGMTVVNAAHAGIGAEASRRGETFKDALGALGYAVGAVLAGASTSGWPMHVEIDGRVLTGAGASLLMVGLAVGTTIGGGTPLAPDADPSDGRVDVVVVSATGPLERVDFARRLRRGDQQERDDVLVARGRRVSVSGGDAPLNVDGELVGPVGSRTWTVRPGAWSVLAPSGL
jgi:YegS/Rv2252/BmrU family lipid kinase